MSDPNHHARSSERQPLSGHQPAQAGGRESRYRALPSVDRLLSEPRIVAAGLPGPLAVALARDVLTAARQQIADGYTAGDITKLIENLLDRSYAILSPGPRPVINATGVIIHTNLGRAPLSRAARTAMDAVGRGYSNLEFDLASGERGSRHAHIEEALRWATGAEAGMAVNNNASALLLVLSALCAGREVIISRGQLVEIGGGFRIPDVMRQSGARLVEVGATNRTYARDYANAAGAETAALLRVHPSNFRQIGFVTQPELGEVREVASARGVLLIDDIGSGALIDSRAYGLAPEPTVQESLGAGADLVLFSGDKLLGGPQAGVIAGRADLVAVLKQHPLARAIRMDKASLAALTATLLHYVRGEAEREVPVWRMIATPLATIERRAGAWQEALGSMTRLYPARSMIGGGSLPEESLPTVALAINDGAPHELARRLRTSNPAIVGRVEQGLLILDPRTVDPADDSEFVATLRKILPTFPQ